MNVGLKGLAWRCT